MEIFSIENGQLTHDDIKDNDQDCVNDNCLCRRLTCRLIVFIQKGGLGISFRASVSDRSLVEFGQTEEQKEDYVHQARYCDGMGIARGKAGFQSVIYRKDSISDQYYYEIEFIGGRIAELKYRYVYHYEKEGCGDHQLHDDQGKLHIRP